MSRLRLPSRLVRLAAVLALLSCSHDVAAPPAPPVVTGLSPSVVVQGTTTTVTITGTNFVSGASVAISGTGVSASGISVTSATSLTASVTAAADAALGTHTLTVTTAGGTSATATLTVNPPAPTLSAVGPATGVQGTTVAVALAGTGFVTGATTVSVSGSDVTVSGVSVASSTSLTANFVVGASATLGDRTVTVTTAGGTSATRTFTVKAPAPTLSALSATTLVAGTNAVVTLTGTNFSSGATIAVTGSGVTVDNVSVASATSMSARFTVASDAATGARSVTVTTVGGTSGAQTLNVNAAVPSISSIAPASGNPGNAVGVAINGVNFVVGATTVSVAGAGVAVSQVNVASTTSLTAIFTIDTAATLGAHAVTLTTAGGTSSAQNFTVVLGPPTLTKLTPNTAFPGTTSTVILTGTNFVPDSTTIGTDGGVAVSNVQVLSGTSISARFTVDPRAGAGPRMMTVTTPAGTSNTKPFTVLPPGPALASLSATTGAQTGTQTITLTGTGFLPGSNVNVTGAAGVTVSNVNVVNASTITADFAVAGAAALGARNVTVTTTSGTSGAQNFTVVLPPTIGSFDALATHLFAAQPSRLRWATSNAATCSINNGIGTLANCTDSLFVTPGTTKTYTLSASSGGVTVTANFQLFANEPGRWVYSTSSAGAVGTHVHQFSLDATTGALTAIGTGNVAAGTATQGLAVDPAGKYVYAVNAGGNNISEYTIDPTTGALSALTTIGTGSSPQEITVDPTGRFAYVINSGTSPGSISRYTISGTGALVANGSTTIGNGAAGIVIDPTGRFLYATNSADRTVSEFSINPDGTLTLIGTINTGAPLGHKPFYMAVDPTGRFLYLTHQNQSQFAQYSIGANGALTQIGGDVNIGGTIEGVAVDPTGRFAYLVDLNNHILFEYTVNQTTGALSVFASPTLPMAFPGTAPKVIAIDPQGKFAYLTYNFGTDVGTFVIDAVTGALSPVTAPLTLTPAGTTPYGVVVSR